MSVQTSYSLEYTPGKAGNRADLSGFYDSISKAAEGGDISVGLGVVKGTADDQAKIPTATGGVFLGITQRSTAGVANASDVQVYAEKSAMTIGRKGRFWAVCEDGCIPGDDVYVRHTAPGTLGTFRTDADTAKADQVVGAQWVTTATAGNLAVIEFG